MNRAFLLVIVPPLIVFAGYIVLFRSLGIAPNYFRLFMAGAGFVAAVWWIRRRSARKAKPAPSGSGQAGQ